MPYWIFAVIPMAMVIIGLVVAFTRKGSVRTASIGSRRHEVLTQADPQTVYDRLLALGGKYKVDDADPQAKMLVLSSSPTFATWGFLYPVYIHAEPHGTRVELGIASKFIQFGPLVGRAHNQLKEAIEQALSLPVARTA